MEVELHRGAENEKGTGKSCEELHKYNMKNSHQFRNDDLPKNIHYSTICGRVWTQKQELCHWPGDLYSLPQFLLGHEAKEHKQLTHLIFKSW